MITLTLAEADVKSLVSTLEMHLQHQVNAYGSSDAGLAAIKTALEGAIAPVETEVALAPAVAIEGAETLIEKITHAVEDVVHGMEGAV